jgi:hypothetical protein
VKVIPLRQGEEHNEGAQRRVKNLFQSSFPEKQVSYFGYPVPVDSKNDGGLLIEYLPGVKGMPGMLYIPPHFVFAAGETTRFATGWVNCA